MEFGLSHLGLGIFIVLLVGVAAWFARMMARANDAREQKAVNRALYQQPWDSDKAHRGSNR